MTSVARRRDHDDSGEYSDASQDIGHNNSGNDGAQHESDYDSQGSDSEHSDQDSENKETERRVDDDEDRSNPQYIPKRGTFYEHDDRTAASGEESSNATSETASEKKEGTEPPTERRRPPRKSEIVNKWSHDKFNENEQMPKSRDELVAIYGYDIRNEDAPPHARRNRRYGRGPNKYTRTWEDEEAYRRQSAAQQQQLPRKPPTAEDFPELDASRRHGKPRTPRPRSKSQPAVEPIVENGAQIRRNASIKTPKKPTVKQGTGRVAVKVPNKGQDRPPKDTMPALENLTITVTNNNQNQAPRKVNAAVAQQRPVPTDQARKKPNANAQPQPPSNHAPNKPPAQQQPAPQQQQQQQQKPQQNQQQNQPQQPATGGGSKRYSSLRQRPLADSYSPQQQPQQMDRYHSGPAGFVSDNVHAPSSQPHAHPQHIIHQVLANSAAGNHASSPPHAIPATQQQPQLAQQVRLGMMEQSQMSQVPHPHHNLHNIPAPHNMGQIQQAQGYAPPAMMPAQYMQQQTSSGAVFPGGMYPTAPHAPPHAQHAPHAPPHAPHAPHAPPHALSNAPLHAPQHPTYPQQMYAPHHNYAGGVTYYNCAEQEPPVPVRTQRRPTAAIPIVSPHHADSRPANSSEKDNIDRIVDNMFVRKPWLAHAPAADSKEKQPENRSSQEPPSKESSQPNSLTSSSISTDSKPSESREEKTEEVKEEKEEKNEAVESAVTQESIATDA